MTLVFQKMEGSSSSQRPDAGQVIEQVYEAATDRSRWPSALEAFSRYSDSLCATYFIWRKDKDTLGFFAGSPDYAGDDLYRSHFSALDPRRKLTQRLPTGGILRCHEHLDDDFVRRSEFYQEFSLPHERRFLMSTHLINNDQVSSFAVLHRTSDRGPFTDHDAKVLQDMAPHLRRAAQIQIRLEEADSAKASSDAALDRLSFGLMTVNRDGRVLSINRMANEMVSAGDGLSLRRGCLAALQAHENATLLRLIRNATEPTTRSMGREGASVALTRSSGRAAYRVVVAPLAEQVSPSFMPSSGRTALVLITDPESACLPPEQHLMSLFGLSSAEAQITVAVLAGKRLEEVAEEREVSLGTVRFQFKSILRKTDTDRQAELIRSMLSIPVIRNDSSQKPLI